MAVITLGVLFGPGATVARADSAPVSPTIGSVSPDHAENNGVVSVRIGGQGFTTSATVQFYYNRHKGEHFIINPTEYTGRNDTYMQATFDLAGTRAFIYDVIVDNHNGATATRYDGFEVRQAGSAWVGAISPNSGADTWTALRTTITGENFTPSMQFELYTHDSYHKNQFIDIYATDIEFISSTEVHCTFNLAGQQTGYWDVNALSSSRGFLYGRTGIFHLYAGSNHPPVADAGPDADYDDDGSGGAVVTLDGRGSSDPDGEALTYTWRESGAVIAGPTSQPTSQVTLSQGQHLVQLTVSDGSPHDTVDDVEIWVQQAMLAFGVQPSNTHPNQAIAPPITVELRRRVAGTVITDRPTEVRLVETTSANLVGTLKATTVEGVATFGNVAVDVPITGCRLIANATNVNGAQSQPFDVTVDSLVVTRPSAGLYWTTGIENPIEWSGSRGAGCNVKVELSKDNGASWTTLFASTPDDGSVRWTPTSADESEQARLRVTSLQYPSLGDMSDPFTIGPPTMSGWAPVLHFSGQPGDTAVNAVIAPPVRVTVKSSNPPGSDWVDPHELYVTIELDQNPGGATLSGSLSKLLPDDDTVVFDDLRVDQPGHGYTLRAYTVWGGREKDSISEPFDVPEPPTPDTTPPSITAPHSVTAEQASRAGTAVSLGTPEVLDDRDPNPTVTNDAPAVFPLGHTFVTWTARDAAGNSASARQIVTIVDTTSPEVTVPADVTVEYGDSTDPSQTGQATATDVCDAAPTITYDDRPLPGGDGFTRTWQATDASGNVGEGVQYILQEDTTPPVLTVPADITREQTSLAGTEVVDIGQATAEDSHDPAPVVTNDAPEVFPLGETIVTWTATDDWGNESTATQKVTITDFTAPTLDGPDFVTAEQTSRDGAAVDVGQATVSDICDANPTVTNNAPAVFPLGWKTVTWTAIDASGNRSTDYQVVTVVDTTKPVLTVPADITQEQTSPAGTEQLDLGQATATDICDAEVTVTNNAPAVFPLGETVVTWTATDDSSNVATAAQTVTVVDTTPPSITAPAGITLNEGDSGPLGTPDVSDICDANPAVTNDAPAVFVDGRAEVTVTWTARDDSGNAGTAKQTVIVNNVAPAVGAISAPVDPSQVGTEVQASADFTDPGTLDTHTATWNWGDGSTSAATGNEANGSGTAGGNHAYTTPGVYTLTLTVTDKDGGAGTSAYQYVVVYDPNGGFVTGGGWINSPPGAYAPNPGLTGKATFGFNAKYHKGANVPDGQTVFVFKAANLEFHSSSYQWLVVAGAKAQFKGEGTVNGAGGYGFMLTAVDGQINGGGGVDKFRIKIWDKASGNVLYDNQTGASDTDTPSTAIGGGSIVIHTG